MYSFGLLSRKAGNAARDEYALLREVLCVIPGWVEVSVLSLLSLLCGLSLAADGPAVLFRL